MNPPKYRCSYMSRPECMYIVLLYLQLESVDERLLACQQWLLEKQTVINSHPGNFEQLVCLHETVCRWCTPAHFIKRRPKHSVSSLDARLMSPCYWYRWSHVWQKHLKIKAQKENRNVNIFLNVKFEVKSLSSEALIINSLCALTTNK